MFLIRLSLAVLLIASANASAATLRCDNCAETTYESKAIAAGLGVHYVYDLPKAQSRKYQVALECDDNANDGRTTCSKATWPLAVEPEIANFTLELAAYYQVTGGTMKSWFTIYADGTAGGLSAFDVAGPGGPRMQLLTWFNTTPQVLTIRNALPATGAVVHQISVTIASLWNDSMGDTLITVVFPDGSQVTVKWSAINNTAEVIEGSAVDKYGNVIPASNEQLNGMRFDYTREGQNGPARTRMQDYLTAIGAIFNGSAIKWTCVRVGDGKWDCKGI